MLQANSSLFLFDQAAPPPKQHQKVAEGCDSCSLQSLAWSHGRQALAGTSISYLSVIKADHWPAGWRPTLIMPPRDSSISHQPSHLAGNSHTRGIVSHIKADHTHGENNWCVGLNSSFCFLDSRPGASSTKIVQVSDQSIAVEGAAYLIKMCVGFPGCGAEGFADTRRRKGGRQITHLEHPRILLVVQLFAETYKMPSIYLWEGCLCPCSCTHPSFTAAVNLGEPPVRLQTMHAASVDSDWQES